MDYCDLIDLYRAELPNFNAHDYPISFQRFEESISPLFDALTDPDAEARAFVESLAQRRGAMLKRDLKERLNQEKLVLALYLAPAADRRGGAALSFAAAVNKIWNNNYPRNTFLLGSYDVIMRGFDARIFGLPVPGYKRR